jgi:hypothetical protein
VFLLRGLLFLDLLFGLRQLLDMSGGVSQRDKLAAGRKLNRFVEAPAPSFADHITCFFSADILRQASRAFQCGFGMILELRLGLNLTS